MYLYPTDRICSEASNKIKHRKTIEMESDSVSYSVTFPMVPLDVGEFDIEVKAAHVVLGLVDAVKKKLKVVVSHLHPSNLCCTFSIYRAHTNITSLDCVCVL